MAIRGSNLEQAARAAWLYYVAGCNQDEVAATLGMSRQSAQRLIAQAMSAGMVKVRIDHPFARSLDLAQDLRMAHGLDFCEVVPGDPRGAGVAMKLADCIQSWLEKPDPMVLAFGTGRSLRAGIEQMAHVECSQHKLVSLTGNIAPDGSTAYYNVLFSLSDLVTARSYPLMLPVIASSPEEREALAAQRGVRRVIELAAEASVAFVGIGSLDADAPLMLDGFLAQHELARLRAAGGVGEITGWVFDAEGRPVDDPVRDRVASVPLPCRESARVIGTAYGAGKRASILAALRGGLLSGLITDDETAAYLIEQA